MVQASGLDTYRVAPLPRQPRWRVVRRTACRALACNDPRSARGLVWSRCATPCSSTASGATDERRNVLPGIPIADGYQPAAHSSEPCREKDFALVSLMADSGLKYLSTDVYRSR